MSDDKGVLINFPAEPRIRIASITFYGAAIFTRDGQYLSPCIGLDFSKKPLTPEAAHAEMQKIIANGGILGEHGFFIPWPGCATVHFEFIQVPIQNEEREHE